MSCLISALPLKIFNCVAFVHVHNHHCSKLDPQALKCVFVGHSPTQKGYHCFNPKIKKVLLLWKSHFSKLNFFNTPLHWENGYEGSLLELEGNDMVSNKKIRILNFWHGF